MSTIRQMGFSEHSAREASIPTERVFVAASYRDLADANADFAALRQLYADLGATGDFDAVTVGRKASGEVRLHQEPDRSQDSPTDDRPTFSLAAGLAAALFPSVAADIPIRRLDERKILGTVGGVVAIALGRDDLSELGTHLDSSSAGLIGAAQVAHQDRIRAVLTNAHATVVRVASVDVAQIVRLTDHLRRAADKRRRETS